ncbi:MAG: hypothetical protein NVS2B7_37510 [Herpetosiphon sp.]
MAHIRNWLMVEAPHQPPYVIETADRGATRLLFRFLGVEWRGTSVYWVAPLWVTAVGVLIGVISTPTSRPAQRIRTGCGFAASIALSMIVHQFGQIVAGQVVSAPMQAVVLTSSLPYHLYQDIRPYPSRVHIVRALGGPLANVGLGLLMLAAYNGRRRKGVPRFLALLNLVFAAAALVPVPTMDGGAVLHELRNWRSE